MKEANIGNHFLTVVVYIYSIYQLIIKWKNLKQVIFSDGEKALRCPESWSRYQEEKWSFRQDGQHRNQTNREINVELFLIAHVWTSRTSIGLDSWGWKQYMERAGKKDAARKY